MAIEERRVCDIYGTGSGLKRIEITLVIIQDYDEEDAKQFTAVFKEQRDMGKRAVDRAVRFLEKATSRPSN